MPHLRCFAYYDLNVGLRGNFSWKHQRVFVSETLIGEPIGLLPVDDRIYTVYYAAFPIAGFDDIGG